MLVRACASMPSLDCEPAEERLQYDARCLVRLLPENNHEGIGDAKYDPAQNANEEAIHDKACTPARITVQAPEVRHLGGGRHEVLNRRLYESHQG